METTKLRFENIVFLQGEEANEVLQMLDIIGVEQTLNYLQNLHFSNEHTIIEDPSSDNDEKYSKDGYLMTWNTRLGYIGLVYDIHYYVKGNFKYNEGDVVYVFQYYYKEKHINPKFILKNQMWCKVEILEPISDEKGWERYKVKQLDGYRNETEFVVYQNQISTENNLPIAM